MHDIAGLVALAVIGLWIAYLVPHRLRYRQQLLESRTEDRFSEALRVLAVTDAGRRGARAAEARAECGPDAPKRSGLLSPARGVPVGGRTVVTEREGGVVERPYGTQDRLSADDARRAAQERARRAASLARRAAAARRRAVLTGTLLVAGVVAWVVVGLTPVGVVAGIVPTVLLAGVLALGRRAVVAGKAADAAWERRQLARMTAPAAPRARVTGRKHHPSDSHTEVLTQVSAAAGHAAAPGAPDVAAEGPSAAAPATEVGGAEVAGSAEPVAPVEARGDDAGADEGSTGALAETPTVMTAEDAPAGAAAPTSAAAEPSTEAWSPVPVPRPTYTTKATAPRREPLPLVVDDPAAPTSAPAAGADDAADAPADDVPAEGSPVAPTLDLDAILARRRAVGE